ncbi:pantoate--beta-alanine ligase [Bacillus paranthracis]
MCYAEKQRPGHFASVAIVLMKLFNITLPTRCLFRYERCTASCCH